MPACVLSIEHCSNRTAHLALIQYANGYLSYIIAPESLEIGSVICFGDSGMRMDLNGNRLPLKLLPLQKKLHNIGYFAKSAGTFVKVSNFVDSDKKMCILQIPSGEKKLVSTDSLATIGQVSNSKHYSVKFFKAGQRRNIGKHPIVRGVAMNPVDHPHGGGEGKTSGGRVSVSA